MEQLTKRCIRPVFKGSTKKIYLIEDQILASSSYSEDAINEISMLTVLSHPGIVKIEEVMKSQNGDKIWMRQNFRGTSTSQIRGKIPIEDIMQILVQMLKVLVYLESNSILHRDIKAENIVIEYVSEEVVATLLDFGLATNVLNDTLSTNVYNEDVNQDVYYRPPEVNRGKGYDFKADVWALGSAIVEMIAGEEANKVMARIYKYQSRGKDRTSSILESFEMEEKMTCVLSCMLACDPEERPSALDCLSYLQVEYETVKEDKEVFILTLGKDRDVYEWFIDAVSDLGLTYIHLYYALVTFRRLRAIKYNVDGITRGSLILSSIIIDSEVNMRDIVLYLGLRSRQGYAMAQIVFEKLSHSIHIQIPSYSDKFYIRLFKHLEDNGQHEVRLL